MPFKDPERRSQYQKQYREEHREMSIEAQKRWYAKHRDVVKEKSRKWTAAHPQAVYRQRRKQKKIQWLLDLYGTDRLHCDRCKYKGSFEALHFHHKKPEQKQNENDSMGRWIDSPSMKKFQDKVLATDFTILCANCHIELHAGLWNYGE
ncbi:MAG: hypothetical protein ABFD82_17970 [Syntrophaceae bacterium]